jgi:hypothetical protein
MLGAEHPKKNKGSCPKKEKGCGSKMSAGFIGIQY